MNSVNLSSPYASTTVNVTSTSSIGWPPCEENICNVRLFIPTASEEVGILNEYHPSLLGIIPISVDAEVSVELTDITTLAGAEPTLLMGPVTMRSFP